MTRRRSGSLESLARLGLEYIDLVLIHWPLQQLGLFVDTWRALIELRERGLIRSIGVSNFTVDQIARLIAETGVTPAVNQIEMHPDFAQSAMRAWHADHGIVTQSWSPLGRDSQLLRHPVIERLARSNRRTPAQLVLRWHVQLGAIPIPKSSSPGHLAENLAVSGFTLSVADMATLAAIDIGHRLGGDPNTFFEL